MDLNVETAPPTPRAELRAFALAALAAPGLSVRWPPALNAAYEADQTSQRAHELRLAARFGIVLYVSVVVLLNVFCVSKPDWVDVGVQLAVSPFILFAVAQRYFRPERSTLERECAATAAASAVSLVTALAVVNAPGQAALFDFFLVTLPVVSVLFFVRLRLAGAAVFVLVTVLALVGCLAWRTDLPVSLRLYPMGFLLAISAPALFGVHQLERASRRVFLHRLLQSLQIEELASENSLLASLSATDPLTGAANRRRLDLALAELCAAAQGGCFLLVDVDHFKQFNDLHGHLVGDACLREVVRAMQAQLRRGDLLARFGGEEFAVVLPGADEAQAEALAERIRVAIEAHRFSVKEQLVGVTASIGLSAAVPSADPDMIIAAADAALYAAKNNGRNCLRIANYRSGRASAGTVS